MAAATAAGVRRDKAEGVAARFLCWMNGHRGGGGGHTAPAAAVAAPAAARPEERQQHRKQDQPVGRAKEYDQEDHLEECDVEVAGGKGQSKHAQNRRHGALDDGQAEGVEAGRDTLLRPLVLLRHVVVADVGREVDGEADAHDEVDEGDTVQVDAPPRHVAQHSGL